MRPVSIEDAAYAAGFFDGEGCISISYNPSNKSRKKNGKIYVNERYSLYVSLSQNDPAPIDWLVTRFGGSSRFLRGKRSYDQGFYERWNWCITTNAAINFLRTIRPFLIVKASQADIAFEFAETMRRANDTRKLSAETVAKRQELHLKMREIRNAFRVA